MATNIDTLAYAATLKKAGIEHRQAEAQAQAINKVFADALDTQVATKGDIADVKAEIADVKADIKVLKWGMGLILLVTVIPFLQKLFA